ncbi:MAG: hypothetical protein E7583_07670 [Ruminococcaceae bacterium]|nr:hypothetical protein [Oscillospiraceae bacterium]
MKAIGIDIGTTSICGVIIDTASGKVERSITRNSEAFISECQPFEKIQSVEKIMNTADTILAELMSEDVSVIGVTGQMHGIVYIDKDGNACSHLYTWQDGRGDLPYKGTTYAKYIGGSTGFGCVTDFYNCENGVRPENAVAFCTIHDYFVMRLCGRKTPLIHTSDAASFGCFDIVNMRFTNGLDLDVTADFAIAGEYRGIPVSVAIGDNQASVFSCIKEGDLLLNFGTGSQISAICDKVIIGENIETRPYFGGKYLCVGAALCGGRAYSLLKEFYREILEYVGDFDEKQVYAIMDKMLEKHSSSSMTADTRFAGTRADSSITGKIIGITTENFHPSDLTYAVLCGMTDELYGMFEGKDIKYTSLVGSGNGIRKNPALVKIVQERFGMKMKIPSHLEEAAVGAAMFGLVTNGALSVDDASQLIKYN